MLPDAEASDWIRRDHAAAELLATVAAHDGGPGDAVRRAWMTVLCRPDPGDDRRAALFSAVLDELEQAGALDVDPAGELPGAGPFLDGDEEPWAGWWESYPPTWPEGTEVPPGSAVAALRRLPLLHRVLVVLRLVTGLGPDEVETVLGADPDSQEGALVVATSAYLAQLDAQVGVPSS